ncbi:MAG: Eco57I restriction-modification methylase domain-containing protein [Candidatus Hodarchaeota archaeon]
MQLKQGSKSDNSTMDFEFNNQRISRKYQGVIYTPDEISSKMCKLALRKYLNMEVHKKTSLNSHFSSFEDILVEKKPEIRCIVAEAIGKAKIVDPACGSGHFLLKMLFHLEEIYFAFKESPHAFASMPLLEFRKSIVTNNLYGVDIDPQAIKLCKNRLIFVLSGKNASNNDGATRLNIDLNVRSGNSVLGFNERLKTLGEMKSDLKLIEERNLLRENCQRSCEGAVQVLRKSIFEKTDQAREMLTARLLSQPKLSRTKKKLAKMINEDLSLEKRFNEVFHPFHWPLEFSEIDSGGGFDIVIGNPPYIRADSPGAGFQEYRKLVEDLYENLFGKWDLYVAFIQLGMALLKKGGVLHYIIPDAFCTAKYAQETRSQLLSKVKLDQIDFFPGLRLFENVGVHNILLLAIKEMPPRNWKVTRVFHKTLSQEDYREALIAEEVGMLVFRQKIDSTLAKMEQIKPKLGEICFVSKGMVLNSDEKNFKGEFKKNDLLASLKDENHPKAYTTGALIDKYCIRQLKYLEWDTLRVPKRLSRPTFPELYCNPKLMVTRIGCRAVYDETGVITDTNVNLVVPRFYLRQISNRSVNKKTEKALTQQFSALSQEINLRYLCALINSKFGLDYLNSIRKHRMENYIYPNDLKQLPIPKIEKRKQSRIAKAVEKIETFCKEKRSVCAKKQEKYDSLIQAMMRKIDELVEEVYKKCIHKI